MKKFVLCVCLALMVLSIGVPVVQARTPGGAMAFLVGCLFGLREGTEWNEGKDIHWREWLSLVPGVSIWNGIECAQGMTAREFSAKWGANWY